MIYFSVGPVMMSKEVKKIGGSDIPYFRTNEFSTIMYENQENVLKLFDAPENSKAVFLTASGSGSMDSVVSNLVNDDDLVLVIHGGAFGQRFVNIAKFYNINFVEIKLNFGEVLTANHFKSIDMNKVTMVLTQACETSSGIGYDLKMISKICIKYNAMLVVDAVSAFLSEKISMINHHIDVLLTGSQKGIAIAPGVSIVGLSPVALEKLESTKSRSFYLDYKSHLKQMEDGQTPFTPAINILIQLNYRLKEVVNVGFEKTVSKSVSLARYFRKRIVNYPFEFFNAEYPSNCVTALKMNITDGEILFDKLRYEYGCCICPPGGPNKDVVRIGHIGNLKKKDYDVLFNALDDLVNKGILK